jgi:hypothetical protein
MYNPLPDNLTIKKSNVEGLGLFAIENVEAEHIFGITHIQNSDFENGYIRTPLGGFINHSVKPNCVLIFDGDYLKLKSIDFIRDGEEITLKYQIMGYQI